MWTQVKPKTHTVMFDSDKGTVVPSQTVKDGDTATEPTAPTKTGYEFKGWLSDGKPYDFATPVTKDLTLTAKWEKTKVASYTVAFDSADGGDVPSQTVEHGKTAVKPDDPTREGYTFLGWYAGDAAYDWNTPVTGNLVLTAHWLKNEQPRPKTHTVTFDYRNGDPTDVRTVNDGDTVPQPQTPVREGYDFRGWVGIDGSAFDFTLPITADTLVSAKWKRCEEPKPATHTVTFNPNGGTVVEPQTVTDGQPVRRPADPVKDGYVFDGWYLGNDQYDFDRPVTKDLTLTAIYHRKPAPRPNAYTVRFDTGNGSKIDPQTVKQGGKAKKPADPTLDGYRFVGWRLNGRDYDFNTVVSKDVTLTAAWEKDTAATIPGNGSGFNGNQPNGSTGSDANGSTSQNTGDADTGNGETKRNPLATTGATVLGALATAITALSVGVGLMVARKRGKKF